MQQKMPSHIKSQEDLGHYEAAMESGELDSANEIQVDDLLKELDAAVSARGGNISEDKFNEAIEFLDNIEAPVTPSSFDYALKCKIIETGENEFASMHRAMKEIAGDEKITPTSKLASEVPKEVREAHRDLDTAKQVELHKLVEALDNRESDITSDLDALSSVIDSRNNSEPKVFGKVEHQEITDRIIDDRNKLLDTSASERKERWETELGPQAKVEANKANPKQAGIVKEYRNQVLAAERAARKENIPQTEIDKSAGLSL